MPTPQELIAANSEVASLIASRDDAGAVALLNAPTQAATRLLQTWEVKLLVIEAGAYPLIAAAAQSHEVPQVQGAAFTAYSYVTDPSFQTLDITRESTQLMLGALVQGGVIEQSVVDALMALATEQVGLWKLNFGHDATVDEISKIYLADRVAADNAAILKKRRQAYIDAVQSKDEVAIARYGRELTQTLGGAAVKEGIDNGG